jgi:Anti-sigma factor NepR
MVGDEQGGFGGDWSVGLNSASANTLADTEVLARFGVGLRALYKDVLREPVPDHLAPLVNKLKEREGAAEPLQRAVAAFEPAVADRTWI